MPGEGENRVIEHKLTRLFLKKFILFTKAATEYMEVLESMKN